MRIISVLLGFLWLLASQAGAAEPVVASSGAPGTIALGSAAITYYARAGDTLSSIATRLTTRSGNWVALGKLNHISKDISIPIGTGIVIPADLLPDEPNQGRIIAFSGQVTASAANGDKIRVVAGAILQEGAELETGGNSFLTLALADQSRVSLPSNSHIRLSKLRMARYTKSPRTEISLLQGRVESHVTPLGGNKGRFEVHSPFSVTGVRGTHFRVVLNHQQLANEVLSGNVEVGRPGAPAALTLTGGQGNLVRADQIGRALDLLPPPRLAGVSSVAAGAALRFELLPVSGARAYQVQIASDSEAQNILTESRAATPQINIQGLPDGTYFARTSAIDAAGLEGMSRSSRFVLPTAVPVPPASGRASATLSWVGTAGAQAYRLRIARDPDFRVLVDEVELASPRYVNPDLEPGRYYWQVAAVSMRNGQRLQGPFSKAGTLTIAAAQSAPFVDSSDRDKLLLRWNSAPGRKFRVQVARDPGFTWLLLSATADSPEIRLTRPTFGTYYARVQVIHPDGSSDPFSLAQAFVVTDQWIIHDGAPFGVKENRLHGSH